MSNVKPRNYRGKFFVKSCFQSLSSSPVTLLFVDQIMSSKSDSFPTGFVWGAATAAPQIEGAAFVDGKGESVWDRFARMPGKVHGGETLDVACDHYHLFKQDFALMRKPFKNRLFRWLSSGDWILGNTESLLTAHVPPDHSFRRGIVLAVRS